MIRIIDYFTQRPRIGRWLVRVVALVVLIWSVTVDTSHGHSWAERSIPGFWGIFGFFSCMILLIVARLLTRIGIEREEGYYDD